MIYTFMVLKCMTFTRKTVIVNCYGIGMIKLYSAYKVMV